MDGVLPEIANFLRNNPIAGGTVQSAATEQQQIQSIAYFDDTNALSSAIFLGNNDLGLGELMVDRAMKSEPDIDNWCTESFGWITNCGNGIGFGKTPAIARTTSCPPPEAAIAGKGKAVASGSGGNRFKKRKAENPTVVAAETPLEKKTKPEVEKDNKTAIKDQEEAPKENSKGTEVAKRDYIHVRARRGQATDSHSLAERVRREKISAKMKYLQNLVPGCNKITGKAGMLDEIINYVQSLQRQVEFLSMKLAAIAPTLNFGVDGYLANCGYTIPTMGVSSLGQGEASTSSLDITLRRTTSAPVCVPGLDSLCLNQIQHFESNAELQNLYGMIDLQQGMRALPFISDQPFSGFVEAGNVKLEEM